ncbi:hypothetical protein [Asticcacaulis solisilvae]|uniref:hypothetical protein n=1 Tax=Asticcacaulis solisilvae TaxID=1217274 RepID=UPI003FD71FEE
MDGDPNKSMVKYTGLFRKEALDARFEHRYGRPFEAMPSSWSVISLFLALVVVSAVISSFFLPHTQAISVYGELKPAAGEAGPGAVLMASLYLPPRAAAALKAGQSVVLNYDAFPYPYYGNGEGTVVSVADVPARPARLQPDLRLSAPLYVALVKLKAQSVSSPGKPGQLKAGQLKAGQLKAGMTLRAAVVLDRRSVASWLLDPFYQMSAN